METKIISAFPGTGKSYCHKNNKNTLDSDSSQFSWISKGVRHPDFPSNYIEHIKENVGKVEIIFVSSHKVVRDALFDSGLHYTLVYPGRKLKNEYLNRFRARGNDSGFIKMIDEKWDEFLTELENQEFCNHNVLLAGQYMSDILMVKK